MRTTRRPWQILHALSLEQELHGLQGNRQRLRIRPTTRQYRAWHSLVHRRAQCLQWHTRLDYLRGRRQRNVQPHQLQRGHLSVGQRRSQRRLHGARHGQRPGGHHSQPVGIVGLEFHELRHRKSIRQQLQRYVVSGAGVRRSGRRTRSRQRPRVRQFAANRATRGQHVSRLRALRHVRARRNLSEAHAAYIGPKWSARAESVSRMDTERGRQRTAGHIHAQHWLWQCVRGTVWRRRFTVSISHEFEQFEFDLLERD